MFERILISNFSHELKNTQVKITTPYYWIESYFLNKWASKCALLVKNSKTRNELDNYKILSPNIYELLGYT